MSQSGSRNNLTVLLIGLALLFAPALFVAITLEFLILSGDLVLNQISLLEFLELYIIDLVLVVGFAYFVYRLTLWLGEQQLLDSDSDGSESASERDESDESPQ